MKTAYFGISKSNRVNFDKEIEAIGAILSKHGINLLVFVDKYNFDPNKEQELMQTTFKEIDASDLLIVELSKKAIGVGVEVGYAFARKKPIIYLKRKGSRHSTTVGGCSESIIEYETSAQLEARLTKVIQGLI